MSYDPVKMDQILRSVTKFIYNISMIISTKLISIFILLKQSINFPTELVGREV